MVGVVWSFSGGCWARQSTDSVVVMVVVVVVVVVVVAVAAVVVLVVAAAVAVVVVLDVVGGGWSAVRATSAFGGGMPAAFDKHLARRLTQVLSHESNFLLNAHR